MTETITTMMLPCKFCSAPVNVAGDNMLTIDDGRSEITAICHACWQKIDTMVKDRVLSGLTRDDDEDDE